MNLFLRKISRKIPNPILSRLIYLYTSGIKSALFRKPQFKDEVLQKMAFYANQTAPKRLLVDVSHQVYSTQKSGIPRVVNKIAAALLQTDQSDFSFEFVMILNGELYTARRFTERILSLETGSLGIDEKIEIQRGDQILILDNAWDKLPSYLPYFEKVRSFQGKIGTVVNDLLPTQHPEWFPKDFLAVFLSTLPLICQWNDILFCISQTTRKDMAAWVQRNCPQEISRLQLLTFTQGAEIGDTDTQKSPIRESLQQFLQNAKAEKACIFVQVSVIQPRKGQDYALDAFEKLWSRDKNYRLIYVGGKGWMADELYERILNHPEAGKRFFYTGRASESELVEILDQSTALISPSRGEGYGLPVVEAALRGLPVLVSDIPIYHEVVGEGGLFFSLDNTDTLCDCVCEISQWTDAMRKEKAAKVPVGTWQQGANELLAGYL